MRLRLYDIRLSRLPGLLGLLPDQAAAIAEAVNTIQRRLVFAPEAGDEGWWGSWAEAVFKVSRVQPFITFPPEIARLDAASLHSGVIPIRNQFYEYLDFGNGHMTKSKCAGRSLLRAGYTRNNAVTFRDILPEEPRKIAVYVTDPADANDTARVFLSGQDANGNSIHTHDIFNGARGEFVLLEQPFALSEHVYSRLTGIQKDLTQGRVDFYAQDPDGGDQEHILTMQPWEQTAQYRRYYFNNLPRCKDKETTISVSAIVKLELLPVWVDTDYLLIQNLEALCCEGESMRLSEIDSTAAKQMAQERHKEAIRMLQGELTHYIGRKTTAVTIAPFGSARLEKQRIGVMI